MGYSKYAIVKAKYKVYTMDHLKPRARSYTQYEIISDEELMARLIEGRAYEDVFECASGATLRDSPRHFVPFQVSKSLLPSYSGDTQLFKT